MEVEMYWRKFIDGGLIKGCPVQEDTAELSWLLDTCSTVYRQCNIEGGWNRDLYGWLIAKYTPACWVLCTFGTQGAYVIAEVDYGVIWVVISDGEVVNVKCAKAENEEKVKELVQFAAKFGNVKVIGLRNVNGSKTKAVVETSK